MLKIYIKKIILCNFFIYSILTYVGASDNQYNLIMPSGQNLKIEVAATVESRSKGLMYRKTISDNLGMLFVFSDEQIRHFWMKDTFIPLSIAFIDKTGTVVHIADMHPLSLERISSRKKAQYALEVNQGLLQKYGVTIGTTLTIPDIVVE